METISSWWQTLPYRIDPSILTIGTFQVKYYGLMYIAAFSLTYYLLGLRIKRNEFPIKKDQLENYIFQIIIFILIGGRLGYVLFYNFSYFLSNPLEIFLPFRFRDGFEFTGIAGMSYHGAVVSGLAGTYYFAKKNGLKFLSMADFVVSAAPLGYTFGRIGNFLNGELYGRTTESAVGMYFPLAGDRALRHPSQLYEAFFEGIFIFAILWSLRNFKLKSGSLVSFYLILYGVVRFVIEFFREPDDHLGLVLLGMSMGQVLCTGMILAGLFIMSYAYMKKAAE
jgi:phosphatidylglycerol---prolipoprotein diacylglyceryl transferase